MTSITRVRKPAWCALSALILVFYFWTATSSYRPFHPRDTSHEFYNLLTDSLMKGRVSLDARPAPELLALRDPYDPAANERWRLHDASLYRGRYYLYFGVAPALTLYVPWRWLTRKPLSDDVAVTLFCMGGYVFSSLLLFLLLDASQIRPHWILQAAAALALGLGQMAPVVLRRPRVYEVAVSAGYCFLFGGLYFLVRRLVRPDSGRWLLWLSGAFLVLATASRPHCGIFATLLALFYAFYLTRGGAGRRWAWWAEFTPFAIPLMIGGLLIAWYNFIRFDNPLEFGVRYQVGVINFVAQAGTPLALRLRQIFASLYYLLICPPNFLPRFPFLEMSGGAQPFGRPDLFPKDYFQEPVSGILPVMPLCVAGVMLPLLLWRRRWLFREPVRAVLAAMVLCAQLMFAAVSSMPGVSARYELDFVPALLVAGLFLCLLLSARLPRRWMRTAVAAVTAGACCWSCAATMALSVNSYGYPLERPNSPLFASIATGLGAGPDALMRDMETLHVDATITFPDAPPGTREAILTTGIYERWDLLMIQYVPGGKAMFAVVHAGVSDTWAPAVALLPGRPRHLTVDYSAAMKRLTARLDGDVALDFPAVFYPTSRDRVTLGKMPAARFDLRAFSGKIEVPVNGIFAAPRR